MQKSTALAVLSLSACSSGLSNPEADACNRINAWSTGGQNPDEFAEAVATAQRALSESDGSPLTDPLESLARSAEDEQVAHAEAFLVARDDHGWELPEG